MDAKQQFNKVMDELTTSIKPCQYYYKNGIYHDILGVYQQMVKDEFTCRCCIKKHLQIKPDELIIEEDTETDNKDEDGDDVLYRKYDISSPYNDNMTVLMVDDDMKNLINVLCSDTVFNYFCERNNVGSDVIATHMCEDLKKQFLDDYHDNYYFKDDKSNECSVCIEKYNKKGRKKTAFTCGHCVCKKCYNSILECDKSKCPLCRNFVSEKDILEDFFDGWNDDVENPYTNAVDKDKRWNVIINHLEDNGISLPDLKPCEAYKVLYKLFGYEVMYNDDRKNIVFFFIKRF
jgi:hypothetical protein